MSARPKKFIFVTGGVLSGLGKGISRLAGFAWPSSSSIPT